MPDNRAKSYHLPFFSRPATIMMQKTAAKSRAEIHMGESTQTQLQETNPDNFRTKKMSVKVERSPRPPPETFLFILLFLPSVFERHDINNNNLLNS